MKNRRFGIFLAGFVLLSAAFLLLNFHLASSTTRAEKNTGTASIGDGLPDAMQRREKISVFLAGDGPMVSMLEKTLPAEIRGAGLGEIQLVHDLETAGQNPLLVVTFNRPAQIWTPFYATSQFSVQAEYVSNGDTGILGETPVVLNNTNGPALNMDAEYRVSDRSWGLISRPGYTQMLANYLAQQIVATLKELYKV